MCCKNDSSVINGQQLFSYTLHIFSLYINGGVRTVDFRIMSRVFYRCATKNCKIIMISFVKTNLEKLKRQDRQKTLIIDTGWTQKNFNESVGAATVGQTSNRQMILVQKYTTAQTR
jgi:hypothetical protein